MNLNQIKYVYFLGIGGIGMSAIARYFNTLGLKVCGYDKTKTPLTAALEKEGIHVHYTDMGAEVKNYVNTLENTLVVLTPAIPKNHEEWNWLASAKYTILKRSQVLGIITDAYRTIGVAGTHGKTTTSTLLAHLLKQSKVNCAAFLGGISANYDTNLLLNDSGKPIQEQFMVVEADEFDRSFLTLHPEISIITSTDADHLDIYGEHDALKRSFIEFANQTKHVLIHKKELEFNEAITPNKQIKTYSIVSEADYYAKDISIQQGEYYFTLCIEHEVIEHVKLGIPGLHNVENAVAAAAAAHLAGSSTDEIKRGLASFKGVKRRFEYIIKQERCVYIDDYAHHPTEIEATLNSIKRMYPDRKLTAIFQPHLYTRTRDFAEGFSTSLSLADDLILLDIYPARELPIEGVSSSMLLEKITSQNKMLCSKENLVGVIQLKKPELLVTIGAGDIDQFVEPLSQTLKKIHELG